MRRRQSFPAKSSHSPFEKRRNGLLPRQVLIVLFRAVSLNEVSIFARSVMIDRRKEEIR